PEDDYFKIYHIQVKDLIELFEIKTNDYHKQIEEILIDLSHKSVYIKKDIDANIKGDKDKYLVVNWFASSEYIGNGIIEIEISQKMKPYLLKLKDNFTIINLDSVLKLRSIYAIRLYELLLKEYCYYGKKRFIFRFSIKDLKEILGIEDKQYSQIISFKMKVLNIAERELKAKSDFYFEYKTIKTGRAITDIEFIVIDKAKKEDNKQKQLTQKEGSKEIIDIIVSPEDEINKRLIELGFQDYNKIRSEHSDEVILNAFADLEFEIEDRKKRNKDGLKNCGAWVRRRLPKAGEPFQKSLHHNQYIQEQETRKKQEEIKLQEELKAKQEREKKENFIKELDEKINKKIEDLKLNSADEWESIEQEIKDTVNSKIQAPKQEKKAREIITTIIKELTDKDKSRLELDALEKAKTSLIDLGLTEDRKNFHTVLESVKASTCESIIKERYALEIERQLKETSYYKAYEQRAIKESDEIRRRIIIERYLKKAQREYIVN
ncbi:MAG: RepB family plasmid replication initiator protein, partial [Desulfamplus sp.]|nr:RepB family plasmid replication initiator protein [Desulfamplus sp.]